METIEINYKYKPGTRLYKVEYGELKYYDVERVDIKLTVDYEPCVTYQLRVNNSSGTRDTAWDSDIDEYYSLNPEEALKKHSMQLLEKFNTKNEEK